MYWTVSIALNQSNVWCWPQVLPQLMAMRWRFKIPRIMSLMKATGTIPAVKPINHTPTRKLPQNVKPGKWQSNKIAGVLSVSTLHWWWDHHSLMQVSLAVLKYYNSLAMVPLCLVYHQCGTALLMFVTLPMHMLLRHSILKHKVAISFVVAH